MRLKWDQFKDFVTSRSVPIHEKPLDDDNYMLEAWDGPIARYCKLKSDEADYADYVTNFQPAANSSLTDSNGVLLHRTKITKTGWHYQTHGLEFYTGRLDSLYNADCENTDLLLTSIKFYDDEDTELVTGLQAELDDHCIKTVVDFEMDQDIDILGGVLEQSSAPTEDVRLWVVAVPDIPANMGGSIPFIQGGINLRHISSHLQIDGKSPKLMKYDPVYHTNKFRIVVRHNAGTQWPIHMIFKLFREHK